LQFARITESDSDISKFSLLFNQDNSSDQVKQSDNATVRRRSWDLSSTEAKKREKALTDLFACTELSTQLLTYPQFKHFYTTLDPKFQVPGLLISLFLVLSLKKVKQVHFKVCAISQHF
jgi:hypothetical protein